MVVEKVLQYKIITDHPNTNAIREVVISTKWFDIYNQDTFQRRRKSKSKDDGNKSFPTVYTSKDEMIGGLEELRKLGLNILKSKWWTLSNRT